MDNKQVRQTNERDTFSYNTPLSHSSFNYFIKKMISTFNKCQLQLIFQTFERDLQLGIRKTARLYNVLHSILFHRINRHSTYIYIMANLRKLTMLKEEVIVQKNLI